MYSNSNMHSLLIGFPSFLRERRDLHSLLIGFPSFSAKEGILKSQSLFLEKDEHLDIASLNRWPHFVLFCFIFHLGKHNLALGWVSTSTSQVRVAYIHPRCGSSVILTPLLFLLVLIPKLPFFRVLGLMPPSLKDKRTFTEQFLGTQPTVLLKVQ